MRRSELYATDSLSFFIHFAYSLQLSLTNSKILAWAYVCECVYLCVLHTWSGIKFLSFSWHLCWNFFPLEPFRAHSISMTYWIQATSRHLIIGGNLESYCSQTKFHHIFANLSKLCKLGQRPPWSILFVYLLCCLFTLPAVVLTGAWWPLTLDFSIIGLHCLRQS